MYWPPPICHDLAYGYLCAFPSVKSHDADDGGSGIQSLVLVSRSRTLLTHIVPCSFLESIILTHVILFAFVSLRHL